MPALNNNLKINKYKCNSQKYFTSALCIAFYFQIYIKKIIYKWEKTHILYSYIYIIILQESSQL